MLSKKHYNAIAEAIRTSNTISQVVLKLCDYFEEDNPRFDRHRFADACVGD